MSANGYEVRFCTVLPGSSGSIVSLGDRVAVALHTVKSPAPADEWLTDEDRFAVVLLEARHGRLYTRSIEIPLEFGMRPTGANDAKRVFDVERHVAGGLVCRLVSPFRDARGWGNDHFFYRLDLAGESWERLLVVDGGPPAAAPLGDEAEPIAMRVGMLAEPVDVGIPAPVSGRRYSSGFELDWRLYAGGEGVLEIDGCDAAVRAHPDLAGLPVTKTFGLRGASIDVAGVPHVAVTARAFIADAPYRDLLLVIAAR